MAAVLFLISSALQGPPLLNGLLLAIPLMIFATGLGWQWGLLLLPLSLAFVFSTEVSFGAISDPWFYAGLTLAGAIGVAGGHSMFRQWRASERNARANARRAELLSEAAARLHLCEDATALYQELTRLLSAILEISHTAVLVPRHDGLELVATHLWDIELGYQISYDSVCGTAFRTGEEVHVPDTQLEPHYVTPPNAPVTRSELAVPLFVGSEVVAVLNVEHVEPGRFGADERATLRALTKIAEEALEGIRSVSLLEQQRSEQEFLARFNHRLLSAESTKEVSDVVLGELVEGLEIDGGAVFTLQGTRFRVVSDVGHGPAEVRALIRSSGLPWGKGQIYESWLTQQAIFIADYQSIPEADPDYKALGLRAVAIVPIVNAHGRTQAVLEFGSFERPRDWSDRDRALLDIVSSALGVAFERAVLEEQMVELLEIVRGLAQTDDPSRLYEDAVESAVRLIPGAEAGSILVRSGDTFRFAAGHGFDMEALKTAAPLHESEQLRWYAGSVERFRAGIPRLVTGSDVRKHSEASRHGRLDDAIAQNGRISELCANICVPITFQNKVTGILNIDNLNHQGAFGVSDLRLAEAFGQQIGVIIRQTEYREALERSVVTDPLTGLGNREGFNQQLTAEIGRAKRYGHPVNLVMMDLDGFKSINDTLGHQVGDEALIRVAQAIGAHKRDGDTAFRWGGDEFALIIPQVAAEDAARAAERYAEAISTIRIGEHELTVSVGLASYPEDASDHEGLLRVADDLMYERKKTRAPADAPSIEARR